MICKYFGNCGGCSTQHIDYSTQLANKKKAVENTLRAEVKVFSDSCFSYRNRMDFIFNPRGVGLRKKCKWWEITDIDECLISNEKLNKLLLEVRDFFKEVDAFHLKKQIGTYKYAVIRTPSLSSSISIVLNQDSMKLAEAIEKVKRFVTSADNVMITKVGKKSDVSASDDYFVVKGSDSLSEEFMGKKFYFNAQGFFQNNSKMAEKMHEYVNEMLKKYENRKGSLLDLYGGVGVFGIINSPLFKDVTIVESFSVDSANRNIKENNIENARAVLLDAKQLKKLEFGKPLYVITDPPRSGMHLKTIEQLNLLKPEVIIYVSCNLQQLTKELPKFKEYSVKSAALFDLFPNTPHMEVVVELSPA